MIGPKYTRYKLKFVNNQDKLSFLQSTLEVCPQCSQSLGPPVRHSGEIYSVFCFVVLVTVTPLVVQRNTN